MSFLQIINKKKITLISVFLFLYVMLNLFDGPRGLISYFENKNIIKTLSNEKKLLTKKLNYLEILYREKFMVGKRSEKVFVE